MTISVGSAIHRKSAMMTWYKKVGVAAGLGMGVAISCLPTAAMSADLTLSLFLSPLGEVQKPTIVEPFKKESKLDVVVAGRDLGVGAIRTSVESGTNTWDVVAMENIETLQGCEEGFLIKLDKSKIKELADFQTFDEGFECGIPLSIYATVPAYNKKTIKGGEPKSWADFFDLKKWPGKRSMNRRPEDTLEFALIADGVPRGEVYKMLSTPAGVDRAFKKLDQIKSSIVWWTNPGQSRQLLASGEVVMVATYDNGLRFFNKTQGTDFGFVTNDAINHVDYFGILANSKHLDNAYKFLSFASRPDIQASVANGLAIAMPNKKALPLISADLRPFLSANAEHLKDTLNSNAKFWLNNYDELSKKFEAWAARP